MSIRTVADAYLDELAGLDPSAAEAVGRTDALRVPDLSPEAFAARADLDRRTLEAARRAVVATRDVPRPPDGPPGPDAVLAAALVERLEGDLALDDVGFTRSLLAPLATPVHRLREVFDDLPRGTREERARLADHLRAVPVALGQYLVTLERSADAGHLRSRRQVDVVAGHCERWVADGFWPGLARADDGGHGAPGDGDLEHLALAAHEATARFADGLRTRLLPRATTRDGVGRDTYRLTSAAFLGAHVDLDELYDWGWDELGRLLGVAQGVARRTGAASVEDAVDRLDAEPSRRVGVGEPLRDWLQGRLDAVTDLLDGPWFDLPPAVRRVEARITPAASGIMYYTPADAALTRPGRVWWTVPPGARDVATWSAVGTVHHEGLPGHHLQHAVTHGLEHLHPWQRHLCHVHGYAEGWAHYAEHLAGEIGLLEDPAEHLGAVLAQIWRACRVVVDIGLHLDLPVPVGNGLVDAGRWSPRVGVEMLRDVARLDPTTAGFEVDRYLGWPGQALAFTVGARLWRETRAEVERAQGDAFDLKTFHMTALGLGPMGLAPLRDLMSETFGGVR